MDKAIPEEEPQEEAPIQEEPVVTTEPEPEKEYVPTVSFEEAADEIWPQLNNPHPIVVEEPQQVEEQPVETEQPQEEVNEVEAEPVVEAEPIVEQEPAPQEEEQEQPVEEVVIEEPVQEEKEPEPVKEEVKPEPEVYTPTVSFEEAADEIWPQLKNPQPIKEEPKAAPQPKPVIKLKPGLELAPLPAGRKVKKRFIRADGTEAIIWAKDKKTPVITQPKTEPVFFQKKEDKKENKPQKVIKNKNSRKKFRK